MSVKNRLIDLLERFIFKITSGRFIFTIVVAGVYAFLACTSQLTEERINEITLIVVYAYFNTQRSSTGSNDDKDDKEDKKDKITTSKP